ncbi:MAG: peroxiredoxin [Terracidiphilus sp.]
MRKFALFSLAAALMAAAWAAPARADDNAMPAAGQNAPNFKLPSQTGQKISLKSFRGKWVVLYFYPKDMTAGCTIEAHNFQNAQGDFAARNAVILGVSVDSTASHQQFCAKDGLTFHLLSDTTHKVVQAYGSLGGRNGVAMANRNTFLIDPKGKIKNVWTKVSPATAASDVLAAIPIPLQPVQSVKPPGPQTPQ